MAAERGWSTTVTEVQKAAVAAEDHLHRRQAEMADREAMANPGYHRQ
jgi:hypothetical protein